MIRKIINGDVIITGKIQAYDGDEDPRDTRNVTKLGLLRATMPTGLPVFNDTPPTNNVTDVVAAHVLNANGSVDIDFSWNYAQGEILADGFLLLYKTLTSTPSAINIQKDPAVFMGIGKETEQLYSMKGLPAHMATTRAISRSTTPLELSRYASGKTGWPRTRMELSSPLTLAGFRGTTLCSVRNLRRVRITFGIS